MHGRDMYLLSKEIYDGKCPPSIPQSTIIFIFFSGQAVNILFMPNIIFEN